MIGKNQKSHVWEFFLGYINSRKIGDKIYRVEMIQEYRYQFGDDFSETTLDCYRNMSEKLGYIAKREHPGKYVITKHIDVTKSNKLREKYDLLGKLVDCERQRAYLMFKNKSGELNLPKVEQDQSMLNIALNLLLIVNLDNDLNFPLVMAESEDDKKNAVSEVSNILLPVTSFFSNNKELINTETIEEIACGELEENLKKYGLLPGYQALDDALNNFFMHYC